MQKDIGFGRTFANLVSTLRLTAPLVENVSLHHWSTKGKSLPTIQMRQGSTLVPVPQILNSAWPTTRNRSDMKGMPEKLPYPVTSGN